MPRGHTARNQPPTAPFPISFRHLETLFRYPRQRMSQLLRPPHGGPRFQLLETPPFGERSLGQPLVTIGAGVLPIGVLPIESLADGCLANRPSCDDWLPTRKVRSKGRAPEGKQHRIQQLGISTSYSPAVHRPMVNLAAATTQLTEPSNTPLMIFFSRCCRNNTQDQA